MNTWIPIDKESHDSISIKAKQKAVTILTIKSKDVCRPSGQGIKGEWGDTKGF